MADRFNKSDTMDLNHIMKEAYAQENGSADQKADSEARHMSADAPAASFDGGEDFVFSSADAPRTSREKGDRSRKPLIITLAAVGVLLIAGVVTFVLTRPHDSDTPASSSPTQSTGAVAENVIISGINVGGMSDGEALLALTAAEEKLADGISITVACGEKTLTLTKDDFSCLFNTAEILAQAKQNPGAGYTIGMTVAGETFDAIADKVAAETDRAAENAKVASFNAELKDMFTYQEAVAGRKLNRSDLIAQLKKLISSGAVTGTIQAKYDEIKPEYNADYLRQNIRMLSSFTTVSTNTANAMSNQALSLSACNSSIIEPGEVWSFNACTGDTNLESRGYLPASVIVQGRYEIGIGGGICQSSTTIYNAALLCGMDVVERFEHAYPSSYVDYGRDATIDYPNLDLKLKNPFGHQLFLKCWMDGVTLHAEFYGLPEKDFDEIRITTEPPVYGKTSYTVKGARTYYLNGKVVRKEDLPSSTYLNYGSGDTDEPTTAPTAPPTQPATDAPTTPSDTPSETPSESTATTPADEPGTVPDAGETPSGDTGDPSSDSPAEATQTDPSAP